MLLLALLAVGFTAAGSVRRSQQKGVRMLQIRKYTHVCESMHAQVIDGDLLSWILSNPLLPFLHDGDLGPKYDPAET